MFDEALSLLAGFDMGNRAGVQLAALVHGKLESVALADSGAEIGAGSKVRDLGMVDVDLVFADATGGAAVASAIVLVVGEGAGTSATRGWVARRRGRRVGGLATVGDSGTRTRLTLTLCL